MFLDVMFRQFLLLVGEYPYAVDDVAGEDDVVAVGDVQPLAAAQDTADVDTELLQYTQPMEITNKDYVK